MSIRWSHDTVDSRACFAHDAHAGQSMYKLLDQVWRGVKRVSDFEPMDVVRHEGKIYTLRNRRHTVFSMLQRACRDILVMMPVRLYDRGDYKWVEDKFTSTFTTRSRDGLGIRLKSFEHGANVAMHQGAPAFGVNIGGSHWEQQVMKLADQHPHEVDANMLLRLKQRLSSTGSSFEIAI